jgi:fructose-specific phosphotransferase system IIC component
VLTWIAALVIVAAVAGSVAAKLLVRRRAPEGGWFTDASRAAGIFGVLGTMFAVVLAFVIFLALESY